MVVGCFVGGATAGSRFDRGGSIVLAVVVELMGFVECSIVAMGLGDSVLAGDCCSNNIADKEDKGGVLPNTPSPFKTTAFAHDPFDPERIRVLASCNGLLLCSTCIIASLTAYREQITTYVYNPSTNKLDVIPRHLPSKGVNYRNLTFDPSNSPHYKVIVYVTTSRSDSFSIGDFHVYSSQIGTWTLSVQSFCLPKGMYLDRGVYWHGCIYYLSDLNFTGSTVSDGLYFNVDEGRLGTFPGPPIDANLPLTGSYFGESEDHLHFVGVFPSATSLGVYELKSDCSEWFIKYLVDLAPISKAFPEMTKHKACYFRGFTFAFDVLALIRRENFQEDSFLVLEIPGKVIRYNLVDASLKEIWDFDVDFGISPYANLSHYDLSQTLQMRFNGWLRHKVRNVSDQINSKHFCVFTPSEHAIQLDVIGEGHELQGRVSQIEFKAIMEAAKAELLDIGM
uniref:F-box protein At3g26010-like beta-propeller domain-containing protein n=1 Tax=Daucus carota subsp. sativus TaxID=79200 RepID=A0A164XAM9_DAUCS